MALWSYRPRVSAWEITSRNRRAIPVDPSTDGEQFFVLLADAPELGGGHYTIFGEVASGMEAVDAIGAAGSDDGQPRRRIEMKVRPGP